MTEVNETVETGSVETGGEVQATETQTTETQTTEPQGFGIPDEYKEAGWANKIMGEDGNVDQEKLFKHIHNVNSLVGQKTVGLPNWDNADEVQEYLSKVAPESTSDYNFGEAHETFQNVMGEAFQKAGLHPKQAESLIEAYRGMESQQREATYGDEALNQAGTEKFPDGAWESKQDNFVTMLKIAQDNGKQFSALQKVPNDALIEVVDMLDFYFGKFNVAADTNLNKPVSNQTSSERHADVFKEYMEATNKGSLSPEKQSAYLERLSKAKR
jgi:hypothetical protein